MKIKSFDCVEMKRRGGRRVYEQVKDMTPAQELAFWRRRGAQLERHIRVTKYARLARRHVTAPDKACRNLKKG